MIANNLYYSSDEEEDDELIIMLVQAGAAAAVAHLQQQNRDWRSNPRGKRTKYDQERAQKSVMDDYLGPVPRFDFKEFVAMFRVTRGRFQTIMEDFAEDPFFKPTFDCFNNPVASLECKLLHALKTLAFGVAHHTFRDYFQLSSTMARE